jgi:proteic killer suppression protein
VIKSFRHKGLKKFFLSGSVVGIQPNNHAARLRSQLAIIDSAGTIDDIDVSGFRLHPLGGSQTRRWAIRVSGNWRLTFEFHEGNAFILDYEDYH